MGDCLKLQTLEHSAYEATAAHLCRYAQLLSLSDSMLQSLRKLRDHPPPPKCSFSVAELTPLSCLQHLRLVQFVLFAYLSFLFLVPTDQSHTPVALSGTREIAASVQTVAVALCH